MGLREGVDYVCFKEPPKHFDAPHLPIKDFKRTISFRNGSAIKLFSFNYNSLTNGDSCDWMIIDEARFCKQKAVSQAVKCLRGNEEYFGHLSQHKSVTFVTDMPRTQSEFWLLEYLKDVDKEKEKEVKQLLFEKSYLQNKLYDGKKKSKAVVFAINKMIADVDKRMNEVCIDFTYCSLASSFENIYVLGVNTLKNWKRSDTEEEFDISVRNIIPKQIQNCFYASVNSDRSKYYTPKPTSEHLVDYSEERNWTWDGDIDPSQPLYIGMDYNAKICCLMVGQLQDRVITFLKGMHVTSPKKRVDLIQKFSDYYGTRPNKDVVYFYDNTAIAEDADKTIDESFAANTVNELEAAGFNVFPVKLSQTTHAYRFEFWGAIGDGGTEAHPFDFAYNGDNCTDWEYAAQHTQTTTRKIRGKSGFGKDKANEKKEGYDPVKAPHYTEAGDTLAVGLAWIWNGGEVMDSGGVIYN